MSVNALNLFVLDIRHTHTISLFSFFVGGVRLLHAYLIHFHFKLPTARTHGHGVFDDTRTLLRGDTVFGILEVG